MKMTLQADPGELAAKGPAFLDRMAKALEEQAPEVAQALRKAAVDVQAGKRAIMRLPAQQEGLEAIQGLYRQTLTAMLGEMGEALDDASRGDGLEKAGGPFIGPRGGKWADAQHTVAWDDAIHGKMRSGVAHVDQDTVRNLVDAVDFDRAHQAQHLGSFAGIRNSAGQSLPIVRVMAVPSSAGQTTRGTCAVVRDGNKKAVEIRVTVHIPHADEGLSPEARKASMRSTLSHELVHMTDPAILHSGGTDGLATSEYLNDAKEVRAHAHQMVRELVTPEAIGSASKRTWEHDLQRAPAGTTIVSHFAGNPEVGNDDDGTPFAPARTDTFTKLDNGDWRRTTPGKPDRDFDKYDGLEHQMAHMEENEDGFYRLDASALPHDPVAWADKHSTTWRKVKNHVTGENRRKFLRAIANAHVNARAGVAEPVEKSMVAFDEPEGATFQS